MEKHFTATVYIVENRKVLLVFHQKMKKWLPPGGHMEPNETPPETAKREALEETGLEIAFIRQENVWIEAWNATSFERPYLCLLENIPAHGERAAHQHIDLIYLAKPIGGNLAAHPQEIGEVRWFSLQEIEQLTSDQDIFEETKQTLRTLLTPNESYA